jgi:LysR family transcriptional regulator, low CO2-responsive transcriptional regulator
MNYTLHQLQVFLTIVEKRSITKAAEVLFLSQPAVSIQLKNFQEQFEIPLTEIIGRQLYVTEFGFEIAKAAEQIIELVHQINYKTLAFKGLQSGKLTISVVSTGKYVMPYLLTDFIKLNEGIELIMDVTNRSSVLNHLEQNDIDFALVSILPDHLSIEFLPLMDNELYLVGKENPFNSVKQQAPEVMNSLPLIYREDGSGTRFMMEEFVKSKGIFSEKKVVLTSNEAAKQAVLAGLGYSIMPLIGIRHEIARKALEIIPVKTLPIKTKWYLVWLKNKKFSPPADAYLKYIKSHCGELISKNFEVN